MLATPLLLSSLLLLPLAQGTILLAIFRHCLLAPGIKSGDIFTVIMNFLITVVPAKKYSGVYAIPCCMININALKLANMIFQLFLFQCGHFKADRGQRSGISE
jgi:hypothetical protein